MAARMDELGVSIFDVTVATGMMDIDIMSVEAMGTGGRVVEPYWIVVAIESNSEVTPIEVDGISECAEWRKEDRPAGDD